MPTPNRTNSRSATSGSATPPAAHAAPPRVRARQTVSKVPEPVDREEAIRERAYYLYEREGSFNGHALDHWLMAESQVAAGKAAKA